jgi:DNA-binding response OmpR family regulator
VSALDEIHVVVVDDDGRTRECVVEMLRARGHRVTGLSSAAQLLALAHRAPIDVVVLDVVLEGMTGVDAVRLLRAEGRPYVGIVMLTARNDAQSRIEGLRLGADHYVGKPYDEQELIARIEGLARTKRRFESQLASARKPGSVDGDVDATTGLWRASVLEERLNQEWQRAVRSRDPFAVAVVSLRDPGWDVEAHAEALKALAQDLLPLLQHTEVAARAGDAEVLLLLPGSHVGTALPRIQRLAAILSSDGTGAPRRGATAWDLAVCPSPRVVAAPDMVRAAYDALRKAEREGAGSICLQEDQSWIWDPAG